MYEYVKLFGGPYDGRQENVIKGVNSLRMQPPMVPGISPAPEPGTLCPMPTPAPMVVYRRSKADPSRFVYEGEEK